MSTVVAVVVVLVGTVVVGTAVLVEAVVDLHPSVHLADDSRSTGSSERRCSWDHQ